MKFVVGQPDKTKEKPETKIYFWLVVENDHIYLKCCHENSPDNDYSVLSIRPDGLHRYAYVGNDLGFPLDASDRILLKE